MTASTARTWQTILVATGLVVLAAIGTLAWFIISPILPSYSVGAGKSELKLPAYNLAAWHDLPVQVDGRIMPFQSAAINAVRQVTGRAKFEGQDAVAIVLSWMLTRGGTAKGLPSTVTNWEEYPFLLCDDPRLRGPVLKDAGVAEPTHEQLHGKYLTPAQVRNSPQLRQWQFQAMDKRRKDLERGTQYLSPEESKTEEVLQRLAVFDAYTQGDPVVKNNRLGHRKPADPLHLFALDKVKNSPWFSVAELVQCVGDGDTWRLMQIDRLKATPHLYLPPDRQADLAKFQKAVAEGKEKELLDQLSQRLAADREQRVAKFRELATKSLNSGAEYLYGSYALRRDVDKTRFDELIKSTKSAPRPDLSPTDQLAAEVGRILKAGDDEQIEMLAAEAARARKVGYIPGKDEFRTMHMVYLELLHPQLYIEAARAQPYPENKVRKLLLDRAELEQAYVSTNPQTFDEATKRFFNVTTEISKQTDAGYPNAPHVELELLFNRLEPFKWAWVLMALAALCFALSLGFINGFPYYLGFLFFLGSLAFQGVGYYCRVVISGRPPVTNMYETVIFVASMAALFSLVLELIYRPKYIALAGSIVATLGLVLADQLPLSNGFNSAIQPLEPVLRSNFWLIIHVMTIVASYAAAALAWCMGNIVLVKYCVRTPTEAELKSLSKLTYRAMQIAVLLLAAGTFLGGWWAAYSWGRFWGWDPKETWALIALIAYVIPLHMRYIGWVKDFGLAVSAVVCFAAIVMSWYGVNFILGAGLHSYGFGGGGPYYVYLACLVNLQFVIIVCWRYLARKYGQLQEPVALATGEGHRS